MEELEKNYYSMNWHEGGDYSPSAFYEDEEILNFELIPLLENEKKFPKKFILKKVIETKKGISINDDFGSFSKIWLDYLPNSFAFPLMSEKMKDLINSEILGEESIIWIEADVVYKDQSRLYFVPFFTKPLDVLDKKKTTYVGGTDHIVKPYFLKSKVEKYNFFHKPASEEYLYKITPDIFVSQDIEKRILNEKLTGVIFEKIKIHKT